MEDFPVLLLILIIYLIAGASGKKKQKRKREPMRTRRQSERRDARAAMRDRQTHEGFDTAFNKAEAAKHAADASCDVRRMHLHEVSQQAFASAAEGEDPCHAGGLTESEEAPFELVQTQESGMLAQDVLRGVIMSEILMRPHERAAMRRSR